MTVRAEASCEEGYYDFFRDDRLAATQTAWSNALALPLALRRDADAAFIPRVGGVKVRVFLLYAFPLKSSASLTP